MSYRESQAALSNSLDGMTDTTNDPLELSFSQAVSVGIKGQRAEDISTSDNAAVRRFQGARNDTLKGMVEAGEIPQQVWDEHQDLVGMRGTSGAEVHKTDWHGLAQWANDNTGSGFDTDDTEMRETMAYERNNRDRRLDSSGGGAMVGALLGAMTDPVLIAGTILTAPFAAAAIPTRMVASVIARTAISEGIIGVLTELPLQAEIYDFKKKIDSPYTVEDAVGNVLLAGVGGAVLGGGTAAIGKVAFGRFLKMSNKEVADALPAEKLAAEVRQLDPAVEVGVHMDNLQSAELQMGKSVTADVQIPEVDYTKFDTPVSKKEGGPLAKVDDNTPVYYEPTPEELDLEVPDGKGGTYRLGDKLSERTELEAKIETFETCMLGAV